MTERTTYITKIHAEKRWFTCVAMCADMVDAHGDLFTADCVERAADDFMRNKLGKRLGLQHVDFTRAFEYIGHWFTIEGGKFDGLDVPSNSWIARIKVHDDEVWQQILDGNLRGMSIAGTFTYEVPKT